MKPTEESAAMWHDAMAGRFMETQANKTVDELLIVNGDAR